LKQEYQNCNCYVPPYFQTSTQEYLTIKKEIQTLIKLHQPEFLFIGLGFPKQEILAKDLYMELNNNFPLTLLLGASFEFYTNEIKRAPKWIQQIGFEWFYRFLQEPKRMFKRYFIDDVKFISLVYKEYNNLKANNGEKRK
jgi:N-acetylglucosaminyldiphosphoundecaprenol N-acetyl-beta-D-mannosaminyltransferase